MWLLVNAPLAAVLTLTISKSKIFQSLRERAKARSPFLGELLGCPYCLVHWVAGLLAVPSGPLIQLPQRTAWLMVLAIPLMAIMKKSIDTLGGK